MFKDQEIRKILSQIFHLYRIPDEYHLGIYFDDDGSHSDHRVLYLWLENLLDEMPNICFEDIVKAFRAKLPDYYFE